MWDELASDHQQFNVPPPRACFSTITALFSGYETNSGEHIYCSAIHRNVTWLRI